MFASVDRKDLATLPKAEWPTANVEEACGRQEAAGSTPRNDVAQAPARSGVRLRVPRVYVMGDVARPITWH